MKKSACTCNSCHADTCKCGTASEARSGENAPCCCGEACGCAVCDCPPACGCN